MRVNELELEKDLLLILNKALNSVEVIGTERICCTSVWPNSGTQAVRTHQSKIDDDRHCERGLVTRFKCSGEGVGGSIRTPSTVSGKRWWVRRLKRHGDTKRLNW